MRQKKADYPTKAFERAISAFDDFDACTMEYRLLLDTQRALLTAENFDGVVQTMVRGDEIARRAANCGRRLAPVRETLNGEAHDGPRTLELRRRLKQSNTTADFLGSSIAQVMASCIVKRDAAALEIGNDRATQARRGGMGYVVPSNTSASIDIRR